MHMKKPSPRVRSLFAKLLTRQRTFAEMAARGHTFYVEKLHPDWPNESEWLDDPFVPGVQSVRDLADAISIGRLFPEEHGRLTFMRKVATKERLANVFELTDAGRTLLIAWLRTGRTADEDILANEIFRISTDHPREKAKNDGKRKNGAKKARRNP